MGGGAVAAATVGGIVGSVAGAAGGAAGAGVNNLLNPCKPVNPLTAAAFGALFGLLGGAIAEGFAGAGGTAAAAAETETAVATAEAETAVAAEEGAAASNTTAAGVEALEDAGTSNTAIQTYYPPNNGFDGQPVLQTLEPGTVINRIGGPEGRYASPPEISAAARSLPPGSGSLPITSYEVVKPIEVLGGPAAPWFGQVGGGWQYYFQQTIQSLINSGHIVPLP